MPAKSYAHGTSIEAVFRTIAEKRSWKVWRSGWPDFLLANDDGIQFVEVKSHGDRLRPGQIEMFTALERAGVHVKIWWESNPTVLMAWRSFLEATTSHPIPKIGPRRRPKTRRVGLGVLRK